MEERIYGFAPVCRADAKILILGSMPSVQSLRQAFYYAHPQNAFWRIMAEILDAEMPETVDAKKTMLMEHRVALWDVVGSCVRSGSLDSAIQSAQINDFEGLYDVCPQIRAVFFNGATAERLYPKSMRLQYPDWRYCRLPSTSPAYTLKYEKKLELWKAKLKEGLG